MKNEKLYTLLVISVLLLSIPVIGHTANRYWVAKTIGAQWNNPANWSASSGGPGGASVPTAADVAIFEPKNSSKCIINAPVNVSSLYISANFKDTVKQNNYPITVGAGGLLVYGGVFWGGSSDITVTKRLTINGGVFRSTAGLLNVQGTNCDIITGKFLHNNGKVKLQTAATLRGKFVFYDLEFSPVADAVFTLTATDTITADHLLIISGPNAATINSGLIVCKGDAQNTNVHASTGGTVTIVFKGTANQTLVGTSGSPKTGPGAFANILIDKSGGTLFLKGVLSVKGNWTYLNGTVAPGGGTIIFQSGGNVSCQNSASYMNFNNITFNANSAVLTSNLYALGKITISPGATLNGNAKNIFIGGNWDNAGSFNKSTSKVTFNGSVSQYVKKASGFQDFYTITIDKPSGKLYLNAPATVSNSLLLIKGVVVSSAANVLKFLDNSNVSGGSDLGYIGGPVTKTGNDAFTFPLGDTILSVGAYHPLFITAPAAITDEFTARYFASSQSYGTAIQVDSLESISNCEYWLLTRNTGTSTVTPSIGWNSNSCNVQDITRLRVAAWNGNQWANLGRKSAASNPPKGTISASRGLNLMVQPILIGLLRPKRVISEGVLKKKLDAGYYIPFNGYLTFKYDEEYVNNGNELDFTIYDKNRMVVVNAASPGASLNIAYKDNRYGLDIKAANPSLPPGFYVLEVKDKKGEISMLRFKL